MLLRPDRLARRVYEIPLEELIAAGIRGLIIDLDNTLVGYRQQRPSDEDAAWVAAALARGLRIVIVSNNVQGWVSEVAGGLKISFVHKAAKPLPRAFGKALQLLGTTRDQTMVVGDQLFTDVLGAKLCGLKVILTEPFGPREHPAMRLLRFFERLFLRGRQV
ncbi:MAG: YqeG family HAD IIIA-type phosphatase [Candidatus Eremiobacteraeota bacterium]|nr:YqeG family HAD IIIA-type phosphatase [Candidatus Eremiobacteraeota bacterium]MBC5827905.1 YqeG family HAD IIIA-type phosphatase [Candidatus Eremiobacteraeota bacterium]